MKQPSRVNQFFAKYVTFQDRVILKLILFICILTLTIFLLNYFTADYPTNTYPMTTFTPLYVVFFLICAFYGMYAKESSPRGATFLWGFGFYCITVTLSLFLATTIEATPFALIDHTLYQLDLLLGINTTTLVTWIHAHPTLHHTLTNFYLSLDLQLIVIPFFLMIFNQKKRLGIFFISQFISCIIGSLIYFFFPTVGPSGVIHSRFLPLDQMNLPIRFYEIHHYFMITNTTGGLIAFPSFHVIWATLLTYTARGKKYILYPLILINTILVASTVLLGWHYFTDVVAGFIIVFFSLFIAEKCYAQQSIQSSKDT